MLIALCGVLVLGTGEGLGLAQGFELWGEGEVLDLGVLELLAQIDEQLLLVVEFEFELVALFLC